VEVTADHVRSEEADCSAPPTPAGTASLELRDSHRQWIRALVREMRELVAALQQEGIPEGFTADLRRRLERLEQAVGVSPAERGNVVGATLSRLWVLSSELRAKSVRGYCEVGAKERAFFDRQAAEFEQSVEQLRSAVARSRANDGGAGR
jgi:hypothetical protein